jgi:hypothetical protein
MQLENYSERAVAIFGDTKPFKDQLLALGGKFNENLRRGDEKVAGWIFPAKRAEELERFISNAKPASTGITTKPKTTLGTTLGTGTIKRTSQSSSKPDRKELLLRIERLETELECLKQIILKESDSDSDTDFTVAPKSQDAPEMIDTPRPVRLLRGK